VRQLVKLQGHLGAYKTHNAAVLAIHCEGSPTGTEILASKMDFGFPLANDDRLNVVDKYSVTSTYLIDKDGFIRARWLDRVHDRVDGATVLEALKRLESAK
jgi:peroxiredoxin